MPLDPNTRVPIEGLPDNVVRVGHNSARQTEFFVEGNKTFKADHLLLNPVVGLKAEQIDGVWYWVVGCKECLGGKKTWNNYHCCEEHDTCGRCGIPRDKATMIPLPAIGGLPRFAVYGHPDGWRCAPCYEAEKTAEAIAKLTAAEDGVDHEGTSDIVCPHCGNSYCPDCGPAEEKEIECSTCGGKYDVTFEVAVTYTTTIRGDRVTADTYKFDPKR